jgi:hypothetical protein
LLAATHEAALCGWSSLESGKRKVLQRSQIDEAALRRGSPPCGTSGFVAVRQRLLEVPFDPELRSSQDWELFVRLARRQPLAYAADALFQKRQRRNDSISRGADRATVEEILGRLAAVRKQRTWLGEDHYRRRVARSLLRDLATRANPRPYVRAAFAEAGLAATCTALLAEFPKLPKRFLRR